MYEIYLTGCIALLCIVSVQLQVTFDTPASGGATVIISEDKATGSGIYVLQATDPSGNIPVFSILTQSPETPTFSIDENSDSLIVPSQGLDAETATVFNFTFRVTAGSSTAVSGLLTVNVTDVNDNEPTFNNTPYSGGIWKNDPANTTITNVTAVDPDLVKLPITYSIAGAQTVFSVDSSGEITLSDPTGLASLSSPTVLQVQASDGGQTGTATVSITIYVDPCSSIPCQNGGMCNSTRGNYTCSCMSGYDGSYCEQVNYCYQRPCHNEGICINMETNYICWCIGPFFTQNCTEELKCNTRNMTMTENNGSIVDLNNIPDGSSLYTPTLYSATITYTHEPDPPIFTLDGTDLRANNSIDYETTERVNFTFIIQIENASVSCPFTIHVEDINDNPPVFNQSDYQGSIPTGMPAGTIVAQVTATDGDRDEENRRIVFSLNGSGSALFSIDKHGILTSDRALIATDEGAYNITVTASDGMYAALATVYINVYELKCNTSNIYRTESNDITVALKNLTEGSSLYTPTIYPVTITFANKTAHPKFTLAGTNLEATDGLDAEATDSVNFTFTIQIDNASVSCPFIIHVEDINDNPPVFSQPEYTAHIFTSMPAGTTVTQVKATDDDRDDDNKRITYSLIGAGSVLFTINDKGIITSNITLTATEKGEYYITVNASDGIHVASAAVNITVYELKCNTSSIYRTESNDITVALKNLTEGSSLYTPTMYPATVTFANKTAHPKFTLAGTNLVATDGLDAEATDSVNFTFTIQIDNASVSCPFIIHVEDINDNPPVFSQSEYTAHIFTSMPAGTTVTQVKATDDDRDDDNKRITYSLIGAGSVLFTINDKGIITSNITLTATDKGEYYITVNASDGIHVASAAVNITVYELRCVTSSICKTESKDIMVDMKNLTDGSSLFTPTLFPASVIFANKPDHPVFTLNGTDLIATDGLDAEQTLRVDFNFTIEISNASVSCPFTINVEDTNDNPPVFNSTEYPVSIPTGKPAGTTVVNVTATDADRDEHNRRIVFSMSGSGSDLFSIDTEGRLTTTSMLTVTDHAGMYDITVNVTDGSHVASATVRISVYAKTSPMTQPTTTTTSASTVSTSTSMTTTTTSPTTRKETPLINSSTTMTPVPPNTSTTASTSSTRSETPLINSSTTMTLVPPNTSTITSTSSTRRNETPLIHSSTTNTNVSPSKPSTATTSTETPARGSTRQPITTSEYPDGHRVDPGLQVFIGFILVLGLIIWVIYVTMRARKDNKGHTEMTIVDKPLNELIDEMLNKENGIKVTIDRGRIVISGQDLLSWLQAHCNGKAKVQHTASLLLQQSYIKALDTDGQQIKQEGRYTVQLELIADRMINRTTGVSFQVGDVGEIFTGQDVLEWLMNKLPIGHKDDAIQVANIMYHHKEILPVHEHVDLEVKWDSTCFMFGLQVIAGEMYKVDKGLRFQFEGGLECFRGKDLIEWLLNKFGLRNEVSAIQTAKRLLNHSYIEATDGDAKTFEPDKCYVLKGRQGKRASADMDHRRHHVQIDGTQCRQTTYF